jgi:hypothetical protein
MDLDHSRSRNIHSCHVAKHDRYNARNSNPLNPGVLPVKEAAARIKINKLLEAKAEDKNPLIGKEQARK